MFPKQYSNLRCSIDLESELTTRVHRDDQLLPLIALYGHSDDAF